MNKFNFRVGDRVVGVGCHKECVGFNGVACTIQEELLPGYFKMKADHYIDGRREFCLAGRDLERHFELEEIYFSPLYKALS